MKSFIQSAIGSLLVFLLVLAFSRSSLPTYNESEVLGLVLSSVVYVLVLWAVSVPLILIPLFAGMVIGASVSRRDGRAVGGCLGVFFGMAILVLFEVWFLQSGHNYDVISWFPQFTSGQAWAVALLTFAIGIIGRDWGSKDKS